MPIFEKVGGRRLGPAPESKSEHQDQRRKLVEYMFYDPAWVEQHNLNPLTDRVDGLAVLLYNPHMPQAFLNLRCIGYFNDARKFAFGMVYNFPADLAPRTVPVDLKTLTNTFDEPDLGTLFNLAKKLIRGVAAFHKTGWLCKNIGSHNVIFFDDQLYEQLKAIDSASKARSTVPKPLIEPQNKSKPSGKAEDHLKPVKKSKFSLLSKMTRGKKSDKSLEASLVTPSTGSLSSTQ